MPYVAGGDWAAEYVERDDCGCGRGPGACCGTPQCPACHPDEGADMPREGRRRNPDMEALYHRSRGYGFQLLGYGYKPEPLWKGGDGGEPGLPYYGMEIEISCSSTEVMEWAAENFGTDLVYLKSDGSVRGFEMVTHPMTFEWALEHFPWHHLPTLKNKGCHIIPDGNGIHVHVSRSGFGGKAGVGQDAHMLRWFKLFYRNQDDVIRIARRNSSWGTFDARHQRGQMAHLKARKGILDRANEGIRRQVRGLQEQLNADLRHAERDYREAQRSLSQRYDAAYGITNPERMEREIEEIYEDERRNRDTYRATRSRLEAAANERIITIRRGTLEDTTGARYSAINTNPAETFEVRAFASTLDPVSAQSTIGLVAASVEYTRHLTAHEIIKSDGLKWPKFAEWLDGQPLYAAVKYANEHAVYPSPARSAI